MKFSPLISASVIALATITVASCNTTSTMTIPTVTSTNPISIDQPLNKQASFALSKVVANLRRGTTIAHFPAGGFEGIEGIYCNYSYQGKATIEWGAGSSVLGNWSTELGEIFHEVLSQKGLNVAGDPKDMFGQDEAVSFAEYLIGARISEIRGNFCNVHDWWDGKPLDEYSGEMYVSIEWTVFSNLLQRKVLKTTTEGYFKQNIPKRDGIIITFHNAFAHATENLMASQDFVNVVLRKLPSKSEEAAGPTIYIKPLELRDSPLEESIDRILPAVVTVRVGTGHGSGFIVSENGLVITNAHVVGQAKNVTVILNNGLELQGKVLRLHKLRDVALIKVPLRIPWALPIRDREAAPLERVYVVGSPMDEGMRSNITTGIVSALRREEGSGLDFIQSDAAISGGNSGGPLLDENGNVIGISVSMYAGTTIQSLNMFIPINSGLEALNIEKESPGS